MVYRRGEDFSRRRPLQWLRLRVGAIDRRANSRIVEIADFAKLAPKLLRQLILEQPKFQADSDIVYAFNEDDDVQVAIPMSLESCKTSARQVCQPTVARAR